MGKLRQGQARGALPRRRPDPRLSEADGNEVPPSEAHSRPEEGPCPAQAGASAGDLFGGSGHPSLLWGPSAPRLRPQLPLPHALLPPPCVWPPCTHVVPSRFPKTPASVWGTGPAPGRGRQSASWLTFRTAPKGPDGRGPAQSPSGDELASLLPPSCPGQKPLGSWDTSPEDGATEQSGVPAVLLWGGRAPAALSPGCRMTAVAGGEETKEAGSPGPEAGCPPISLLNVCPCPSSEQ